MHPQVWVTSGHVGSFSDPLVECQTDHRRFRLDELPGAEDLSATELARPGDRRAARPEVPGRRRAAVGAAPVQPDVQDVHGPGRGGRLGHLPAPRDRPGLVRQLQERPAVVAQEAAVRDRPDRQVVPQRDLARATSCSGCASSSRWRCSTSCARTRRPPRRSRSGCPARRAWYERYGVTPSRLRLREHAPDELAHYAKKAVDVEYRFPFGWKELEGVHNRGDFDLSRHSEASGEIARVLRPGDRRARHPVGRRDRRRARTERRSRSSSTPTARRRSAARRASRWRSIPISRRTRWRCCRC